MAHFELNSIETISRSLKNTVFVDNHEKVNFPLSNSGFSPGPKIYLMKELLQDRKEVKKLYKTLRKMLIKFYIEEFGIILTYHMSQIEEIKLMGIDTNGHFRLVNHKQKPIKKKLPKLSKKMIKKSQFSKSNTLEEVGLMSKELYSQNKQAEHSTFSENEKSQIEFLKARPISFLKMKNSNPKFSAFKNGRKIKNLHIISSKVNKQVAVCKCKSDHKLHLKLIMIAQSLLFVINNSIDTNNTPWYSMPDFIALLLEDILRITSIMRFIGPTFTHFKNIKEYYKYSKKHINRSQKKHFLKFFSDRRNSYQTKFLLQILGITVSFFGNIFNSFIEDFRNSHYFVDLATQIEISNPNDLKNKNPILQKFSKQDFILISEYIERLPNKNNCIIYPMVENTSISTPDQKSIFSLC
ncbi:uncharacterized protein ELE39_003684 [Cryptosporidium sp. chipmunk genotype I]|uniref:uncharacterized protein n=1 Tax=Cryptosporidium sp. chipmunk genotype I TaxID=1280935 RepID=UPI00351A957C|nr:hypothetical protein ELE39_003684 [Cryptosporidium sp. chipmunk genotype I]